MCRCCAVLGAWPIVIATTSVLIRLSIKPIIGWINLRLLWLFLVMRWGEKAEAWSGRSWIGLVVSSQGQGERGSPGKLSQQLEVHSTRSQTVWRVHSTQELPCACPYHSWITTCRSWSLAFLLTLKARLEDASALPDHDVLNQLEGTRRMMSN